MSKTQKPFVLSLFAGTALTLSALGVAAQTTPVQTTPPQTPPVQTPPIAPLPVKPSGAPAGQQPQQQPVDPASIKVKVDPAEVDFGEIPTGDVGARMVKLINTSDQPMTIVTHRVTCGCTALDLAPNYILGPKEVKEVKVQLNGGPNPGPLAGKKVTFVVSGQPEIELHLKANAVSFVTQEPASISPELNADGKITLKSRDNTPFRILSMQPPLITEFPKEAAAEHTLNLDWAKYREMGISRKAVFYFDHPKCQSLMANVQFSQDELVAEQTRVREAQIAAQAAQGVLTPQNAVANRQPVDPNVALATMIQQGQNDEVIKKIAEGLDPNTRDQQGMSLLSQAAKYGNVDLMNALIRAKADINSTDSAARTPLMHAGTSKNLEAVTTLLDHGASVTPRDVIGGTALSWAAGFGDAASVKALIDAGAEVDVVGTITGWTPLVWASGFGDPASVPLLTDLGANVEVADFLEGATPMIHAARTGKVESLQALLKAGAKLETPDLNGNTPLLSAAKNSGGDAEKVKFLIDAGGDIHAKDNRGMNALALARKRTDPRGPDVVRLLDPLLGAETPTETIAPAAAANTPAAPPAGASGAAGDGHEGHNHDGHAHEKPGSR